MNEERKCLFMIVDLEGRKQEYVCDPAKGCLRKKVWSEGVNKVAAEVFDKDLKVIEAYVKGTCTDGN